MAVVYDQLYISQGVQDFSLQGNRLLWRFWPYEHDIEIEFIQLLDSELDATSNLPIVISAAEVRRASNAVFLLGAYVIVRLDITLGQVEHQFCFLSSAFLESTVMQPTSALTSSELAKSKARGWINLTKLRGMLVHLEFHLYGQVPPV